MNFTAIVAASIGSAAFFSLATALKHRSASQMPHMDRLSPGRIVGYVWATLKNPLWLGGIAADVFGLALQVYALHIGPLSVVQPLLVSAVLFSLVVAHRIAGTRVSRREVLLGSVLVVAVAGFLVVSGAFEIREGRTHFWSTVIASVVAVLIVLGCVIGARRGRQDPTRSRRAAALLGVAAGTIYACTAALIKSCTHVLQLHGLVGLLTTWQPYVLLIAGATGLFLAQMAFQAGPLAASLPATATTDPLASVALGLVIFHERLHSDPLSVIVSLACLAAMTIAVRQLSRVRAQVEQDVASGTSHQTTP
ncbi:MAG: DMT family transporter [Lapillicoccus sp.]